MQGIIRFFGRLLYNLCYFIGKYVCKAIAAIAKFGWKTSKSLYEQYKEKKAASAASAEDGESASDIMTKETADGGEEKPAQTEATEEVKAEE